MSMSVAKAAEQFLKGKKLEAEAKALLDAPRKILLEHFRESGQQNYKGKISYSATTYRSLDTDAVKEELGERLHKFQIVRTRETLSPIQK